MDEGAIWGGAVAGNLRMPKEKVDVMGTYPWGSGWRRMGSRRADEGSAGIDRIAGWTEVVGRFTRFVDEYD
jgi:hypothetical protein